MQYNRHVRFLKEIFMFYEVTLVALNKKLNMDKRVKSLPQRWGGTITGGKAKRVHGSK